MISLFSRPRPPRPPKKIAGDGYQPPYSYGTYELIPYNETNLPARNPGSAWPWTETPNYPPGLTGTKGMLIAYSVASADAAKRPGLAGTNSTNFDGRTSWAPFVTVQQVAINTALRQKVPS